MTKRVLTSGYISLDHIVKIKSPARVGFTSIIENKTCGDIQFGGCSVNIAYALARLGLPATPILRVGSDYESTGLRAFLEAGGVDTSAVTNVPEERTSLCYLVQDNEGQHITLYYPGSMAGVYFRPLPDAHFEGAALGVMTVGARCDNEEFLRQCRAHGVPLVFGMKGDMEAFPRDFLEELLGVSRVIFTNECERASIEALLGREITGYLGEGGAEIVVTTLGAEGSVVYWKDGGALKEARVPIYRRANVVDTTGSGDGYISGFLYGYLGGKSSEECGRLGSVLSSFIIEREGCCTGAPDEAQLLARYEIYRADLGGK
jgi:adenosine kinase